MLLSQVDADWERALLPPEPGRLEQRVGVGLNVLERAGGAALSPGTVLGFRATLSRRWSVGAPLFVQLTVSEPVGARPGFAVSGGVTGFNFTDAEGFIVLSELHVDAFWRFSNGVARLRTGFTSRWGSAHSATLPVTVDVQGAVLQRLGSRVLVGVELGARWQVAPTVERAPQLDAGATYWPKVGPTVRVLLSESWSVDLLARVTTGPGLPGAALFAGAAVAWAPLFREPQQRLAGAMVWPASDAR